MSEHIAMVGLQVNLYWEVVTDFQSLNSHIEEKRDM